MADRSDSTNSRPAIEFVRATGRPVLVGHRDRAARIREAMVCPGRHGRRLHPGYETGRGDRRGGGGYLIPIGPQRLSIAIEWPLPGMYTHAIVIETALYLCRELIRNKAIEQPESAENTSVFGFLPSDVFSPDQGWFRVAGGLAMSLGGADQSISYSVRANCGRWSGCSAQARRSPRRRSRSRSRSRPSTAGATSTAGCRPTTPNGCASWSARTRG